MTSTKLTADEVIVFDSSNFIEEAGLTSRGASALKHYLRHRGTQLVVPEAAREECERNLIKRMVGRIDKIEYDLEWLARVCSKVNGWNPPTSDEIADRARTLARATHLKAIVLPETETLRARARERDHAQRPPSHRKASLGDCRIWEQCLELLKDHDVVFVARDGDFRSGWSPKEEKLHPQLQTEADAVGAGRTLTFHCRMESLLSELKHEIPSIPKERVLAFVYEAIAGNIEELEANSGYRANNDGDVDLHFLTTDDADIVEVRLEITNEWGNPHDGTVRNFYARGVCQYHLLEQELRDLKVSNVRLSTTEPDGSLRATKGSFVSVSAEFFGGPRPIRPKQEPLGQREPTDA